MYLIQGSFHAGNKKSLTLSARKNESNLDDVPIHAKPPQFSILHAAALTGNKEKLQKLLKSEYFDAGNVDTKDKYGRTPLIFAVLGNHSDIVEFLLKV